MCLGSLQLRSAARQQLLDMLPEDMKRGFAPYLQPDETSVEWKLVKAADRISAYLKCVTEEKLGMVDKAEQLLLDMGFHQLRVRIHGTIARIEVQPDEFEKLLANREAIVTAFKSYGFSYVTMDLQGYRMGSMNETLGLKK